jgi:hypothetical protein
MRLPLRATGLFAIGLLVTGSPLLAAPPKEVNKLHVLMVFDTLDEILADSLQIDESRMREFLTSNIPPNRHSLTVLKGEQVSRERILNHYRQAKPKATDGLLFFYGGHGATDPTKKHHFQLACKQDLLRSDVRKAMEAKKTALVVLLSDCCSTPQKFAKVGPRKIERVPGGMQMHPTVRCLLFQARGTVDVTAATNAPSWSDNLEGGLFTRTLCKMMTRSIESLDRNRDGFVSWREFFPQLQGDTEKTFTTWSADMRARGAKIDARSSQRPSSFALGEDGSSRKSYAVVGIENGTTRTIPYRYRWTGEQEWKDANLAMGERKVHFVSLRQGQEDLPDLEIQISGRMMPVRKAGKWTGAGKPSFNDGRNYRLGSRKRE